MVRTGGKQRTERTVADEFLKFIGHSYVEWVARDGVSRQIAHCIDVFDEAKLLLNVIDTIQILDLNLCLLADNHEKCSHRCVLPCHVCIIRVCQPFIVDERVKFVCCQITILVDELMKRLGGQIRTLDLGPFWGACWGGKTGEKLGRARSNTSDKGERVHVTAAT